MKTPLPWIPSIPWLVGARYLSTFWTSLSLVHFYLFAPNQERRLDFVFHFWASFSGLCLCSLSHHSRYTLCTVLIFPVLAHSLPPLVHILILHDVFTSCQHIPSYHDFDLPDTTSHCTTSYLSILTFYVNLAQTHIPSTLRV